MDKAEGNVVSSPTILLPELLSLIVKYCEATDPTTFTSFISVNKQYWKKSQDQELWRSLFFQYFVGKINTRGLYESVKNQVVMTTSHCQPTFSWKLTFGVFALQKPRYCYVRHCWCESKSGQQIETYQCYVKKNRMKLRFFKWKQEMKKRLKIDISRYDTRSGVLQFKKFSDIPKKGEKKLITIWISFEKGDYFLGDVGVDGYVKGQLRY